MKGSKKPTLGDKRRFAVRLLGLCPSKGKNIDYLDDNKHIYLEAVQAQMLEEEFTTSLRYALQFAVCAVFLILMEYESPYACRFPVICLFLYLGIRTRQRGIVDEWRRWQQGREDLNEGVCYAALAKYGIRDPNGHRKLSTEINKAVPILREVLKFELLVSTEASIPWTLREGRDPFTDDEEEEDRNEDREPETDWKTFAQEAMKVLL